MDIEEQPQKEHRRAQVDIHHIPITSSPQPVHVLKRHKNFIAVGRANGLVQVFEDKSFKDWGHFVSVIAQVTSIAWLDDTCNTAHSILAFAVTYLNGLINIFDLNSPYASKNCQFQCAIYHVEKFGDNLLALACGDGTVKIVTLDEENHMTLLHTSTSYPETQVLSLAIRAQTIYASYSNGFIRTFQFKAPHMLQLTQSVTLQPSSTAISKEKAIIPWVLKCTSNQLWVGTSNGYVLVFETKFLTEVKKFHTHLAPILSATISDNIAYFSGVDTKIVLIDTQSHQIIGEMRGQSNDVYAIEGLENNRIISSGVNADLCVYSIEKLQPVYRFQAAPSKGQFNVLALRQHSSKSVLILQNNYNNISLHAVNKSTHVQTLIAEIQVPELVLFAATNGIHLVYSHQSQSVVIQLQWEQTQLIGMKKVLNLEPIISATFWKGQLYYVNKSGLLFKIDVSTQKSSFIFNTNITSCSSLTIAHRMLILASVKTNSVLTFNLQDHDHQELQLTLANHDLQEIAIVNGQNLILIAIYQNNRFAVYINSPKQPAWRLNQHSKQYLYQFPKSFLQMKPRIQGAICDGVDEKRLLFYSNSTLIKVHQRGSPPHEITEQIGNSELLTLNQNYQLVTLENYLISLIQLQKTKKSTTQVIALEWNKEQSFANIAPAFDAKKYKQ